MKKENWIYLLAFLCGVIIINLLGRDVWVNSSLLNRYNLMALSFREIEHEEYLVQILLLRFRTVAGLWVIAQVVPKKVVVVGFAGGISLMLGSIMTMFIIINGMWGILFFLSALLPQGIFYGMAYRLWSNITRNDEKVAITALILMLTVVGCTCEAYISPVLIENVIKF